MRGVVRFYLYINYIPHCVIIFLSNKNNQLFNSKSSMAILPIEKKRFRTYLIIR